MARARRGRPPEHFTSSPGGYFHGMVAKAKAGQLNLTRRAALKEMARLDQVLGLT